MHNIRSYQLHGVMVLTEYFIAEKPLSPEQIAQHFHDIYSLLLHKLVSFAYADDFSEEDGKKMQELLQELLSLRAMLREEKD